MILYDTNDTLLCKWYIMIKTINYATLIGTLRYKYIYI